MAISTFGELKTAVADHLWRSDLTAFIPDFIEMARSRIHYGSRNPNMPGFDSEPLRIRAMEQVTDPTTYQTVAGTATLALPARFLSARTCYLNTSPLSPLTYVTPEQLVSTYIGSISAKPDAFTLRGDNLMFGPTPDQGYGVVLHYYQAFAAFSLDADTNWLLTNAPQVWLYGAMLEACNFASDEGRADRYFQLYSAAVNGLSAANQLDRWTGSVLLIRTDTGAP